MNEKQAFELGVKHGGEMANESGSNQAGCEGWDGMLINADPQFAREQFGWSEDASSRVDNPLLDAYCRGCQSGADAAVGL
jgi:hypothetical protein